ncbi:MAG: Fur family transcriptional regulator [Pseudomonadota bacterium]
MAAATGFHDHDHEACRASLIARVERLCGARGLQFTPQRRRVLEILVQSHRATGAYDILAVLEAEGHAPQPPIVYRALDFLTGLGCVHRIERLNAFVACSNPGEAHHPAFMICRGCKCVAEMEAPPPLSEEAREVGFKVETTVVELEGLCPRCGASA